MKLSNKALTCILLLMAALTLTLTSFGWPGHADRIKPNERTRNSGSRDSTSKQLVTPSNRVANGMAGTSERGIDNKIGAQTFTLTVPSNPAGQVTSSPPGIDCGTICSATFPHGTTVTLTPRASSSGSSVQWLFCDSVVDGQCTVLMNRNRSPRHSFIYPIVLTKNGPGTGIIQTNHWGFNCTLDCQSTQSAKSGYLELWATAGDGSVFTGWGGSCTGTDKCLVKMDSPKTIIANFTFPCAPAPVGLIAWYSGDGSALESRSRINGILLNGASFAVGRNGQAFTFDGANDYVRVPHNDSLNLTTFTLETWAKTNQAAGRVGIIWSKNATFEGFNDPFMLSILPDGKVVGRVGKGDNRTEIDVFSTGPVNDNNWHHLALTFDGSVLRLFVDGNLNSSQPVPFSLFNNRQDVIIGQWAANPSAPLHNYRGQLDELSLYDRALSDFEVTALYLAGRGGKCKPTATIAPGGHVAWFAGDGDANDIAGTNNGALQNGASFAIGKVGQGLSFDGTDDFFEAALTQSFSNVTLEAWVKPLSAVNDSINQELIFGQVGTAQIVVRPGTGGGSKAVFQFRDSSSGFQQVISVGDIPLDDWSHIAGTYDGVTLKLHINGVLNAQLSPTNLTVASCPSPLFIGGFPAGTFCSISNPPFQFFNGIVDEASIYNRALSDAEITSIFKAGVAGKLKLISPTDRSGMISLWRGEDNANDSRRANNGSFPTNTFAPGQVGQAFQTNRGSISVPDSASLDLTNAYTIEMWVSPSQPGQPDGTTFFACKGNCFAADDQPYSLGFAPDRRLFLTVGNNSTIDRATSNSALPLDTFSHVAGTYDGTALRIYVNGILDITNATSIGVLINSGNPLVFGGSNISPTAGLFDEVALYNRALSDAEITSHFNAGIAGHVIETRTSETLATVGDVTITYPSAGFRRTQQIPLAATDLPPIPPGYETGSLLYDIGTDSLPTGPLDLCFNLPSFNDPSQYSRLHILQLQDGAWQNRTITNTFAARQLCGQTSSLSPFAIAAVVTQDIVFVSNREGLARIYAMRADGDSVLSLTAGPFSGEVAGPALSPDRTKIVFSRFDGDGPGELYIINANGTGLRRLTPPGWGFGGGSPSWSPDGNKIAFERKAVTNGIWNREIYSIRADGTELTRLTTNTFSDEQPAWSPDGRTIAFVSKRTNNFDIYLMDENGANQRRIVFFIGDATHPTWSPDGKKPAFASLAWDDSEIYTVRWRGARIGDKPLFVRMTRNPAFDGEPAWESNDTILFTTDRDGNREIYRLNVLDRSVIRLTDNPALDGQADS